MADGSASAVRVADRPEPSVSGGPPVVAPRAFRYCAFLSYSHRDAATAKWLHESLEKYRVPRPLVGRETGEGRIPARLTPVFRDQGELAASGDLGHDLSAALAGARFLVVLCSPAAVASRWTNEEIAAFKKLRPDGGVLAAIVAGEPFASELPGRADEECFPPALRVKFDRRGRPTRQRAEPIAADFRAGGEGRRTGFLKLVAGMLGVGLDELVRREAHRRHRRQRLVMLALLAGMAFTTTLSVIAIHARNTAREQRQQAEGLVGFMLGDLRTKLEPVGRLDLLDAVGDRALGYYRGQDKASLTDDGLAQRSLALTMMGSIADKRGQVDRALARYREALAGTEEALRRAPDDPQRMFDHAQSVYWVGSIALERGQVDEAAARFEQYRALAARMIATDPANPKWQLEAVYAASNLGTVEEAQRRYAEAAATFSASLAAIERLAGTDPGNRDYQKLRIEILAYLADALGEAGQLDAAISARQRQLAILAPSLAGGRTDEELRQDAMIANMALSRLLFVHGDSAAALVDAATAVAIGRQLVSVEPTNADWQGRSASTMINQAILLLRVGRTAEASGAARAGCEQIDRLRQRDSTVASWRDWGRRCLALRAELASDRGDGAQGIALARQLLATGARIQAPMPAPFATAEAHHLLGDLLGKSRNPSAAQAEWRAALAAWPGTLVETPLELAAKGELLRAVGQRNAAAQIEARLAARGYRQSLTNRINR